MNIDKLLIKLLTENISELEVLESRDIKVLKSLGKIVSTPSFITENQSRLLTKILKENSHKFTDTREEILLSLDAPAWSKPFRPVDKTKKVYILQEEPKIVVEFAFSSAIRKTINNLAKKVSGIEQQQAGKLYKFDLTEKNIVVLVEELKPLGFNFDEKIQDFYKIIKSWSENEIRNQYVLTNITHANFQKTITNDIGIDTPLDETTIADRSIRYQYFLENTKKSPENLVEKIAYRNGPKVWINSNEVSLDDLIASLLQLKRFPTMFVFDTNDHKQCLEDLQFLSESLEKNGIFNQVGIYFRLPNNEYGVEFNKFIAEHQYNCQLDNTTKVVGVQNGKIPKFFIKNDWKPMSVVAIGSSLKQTKTAVYASYADLIISYSDTQPIIETRMLWE